MSVNRILSTNKPILLPSNTKELIDKSLNKTIGCIILGNSGKRHVTLGKHDADIHQVSPIAKGPSSAQLYRSNKSLCSRLSGILRGTKRD